MRLRPNSVLALGAASALAALACAPRASEPPSTAPGRAHALTPEPQAEPAPARVPADVVRRARGPIRAMRLRDSVELAPAALAAELVKWDAVCAGEEHTSVKQHYAETWLFDALAEAASGLGLELGLGLEAFQVVSQGTLTDYQEGWLSEAELLEHSDYRARWGYPFAYYRPLLDRARDGRHFVVALNAPSELSRQVAREGLRSLSPAEARKLPDLDLHDPVHREAFASWMQDHPHPSKHPERLYVAHVLWDETMAERAFEYLARHAPIRRILIVAGRAHCHRHGIPTRMERRGAGRVAAIALADGDFEGIDADGYDYAIAVGDPSP